MMSWPLVVEVSQFGMFITMVLVVVGGVGGGSGSEIVKVVEAVCVLPDESAAFAVTE
jgi:hypothetical protein